ncbi:hypothetical protein [Lentilitoribacter sp. Alg239-R112]|jgi:hypothetical protein|uniref:hypothetical protein n=1 Tax=Lentilitoribacter sp. Alg239-R112 TaxID=2305987 RepID=UPI0018D7623B|nr:hypothetical protein [Lentilitoribacter sp. Alg239-R112]
MARRQKTRFEKFFSINQHRKRLGAVRSTSDNVDLMMLKKQVIDEGEPEQTYGSDKSLEAHLKNLRLEFSGQSELLFYHAKLIVLLRREFQIQKTYASYVELWQQEGAFLINELNLRWLVSACETFADHDEDSTVQAVAIQGSLLANIVKVYETERTLSNAKNLMYDEAKISQLHDNLMPLFGGMSCFAVGTDDTLRNLRWRLNKMFKTPIVGRILEEIFLRLQDEDTAFKRLREAHHRDRTSWW